MAASCLTAGCTPESGGTKAAPVVVSREPTVPIERSAPSYQDVVAEVEARCGRDVEGTTLDMKQTAAEIAECARDLAADGAAVDPRWERLIAASCNVSEESAWIDLDEGVRYHGTMYGFATLSCQRDSYTHQRYLRRAVASGDPHTVVAFARAHEGYDRWLDGELDAMKSKLTQSLAQPQPTEPDMLITQPLTAGEREQLSDSLTSVEHDAETLARDLCQAWPDLRSASGGRCVALMQAGFSRYVTLRPYHCDEGAPGCNRPPS